MSDFVKSYGAFKGLHKGYGIYWSGTYNIEGDGSYPTLAAAREACARAADAMEDCDRQQRRAAIEAGGIPWTRDGDTVTARTPNGPVVCTIRQWRNNVVWDIEDRYDAIAVYAGDLP